MASAAFSIGNAASLLMYEAASGEVVPIALDSVDGVSLSSVTVVATDETTTIGDWTIASSSATSTTITAPAAEGCAAIIEWRVNGGTTYNTRTGQPSAGDLIKRAKICVPTADGSIVLVVGETYETHPTYGWSGPVNIAIRNGGGGGGSGDITAITTSAGSGLLGGVASGAASLSVNLADTGKFSAAGAASRGVVTDASGVITAVGFAGAAGGSLDIRPAFSYDLTVGVTGNGAATALFGGNSTALTQLLSHATPLSMNAGDVGIKAASRVLIEAPATTGTSGIDIRAGAATGSPGAGVVRVRGLNGVTIDSTAGAVAVGASATALNLGGAAVPVASTCTTWGITASGACTVSGASWALTTAGLAAVNGLPFDRLVRAWSTTNVANLSSAPGTTIGGVLMSPGETFGLSGQSTPSQNGPWVFNGSGSAATRPTWFDLGAEAVLGMVIRVAEGTNKSTSWQLETTGAITINSTSLTWAQVNGSGGGGSGDRIDDGSGNGLLAFSGSVSAMGTTSFAGSFTSFSPAADTDVQITAAENWTAGAGAGFAVTLSQGDGSSATIAEDVDVVAAGELTLRSAAGSALALRQTSGGGFFVDASGYLSVESGGSSNLDVIAGAGLNLSAGGAFTLAAGGAVTIGGAGVTKLKPSANVVCSVESANGGSYWAAENTYVSAFTGGNMVFTAAGNVNFDNGGVYGLRGPGPLTISTPGNGRRHQTRWDAPVTPGSSAATNLLTIDCPANRTTCVRREVVVRNGTGNYKVFDLSFAVDCDGSNATASAVTAAVGQSAGTIGTVSSDFTVSVSGLNATLRVANASGYVVTPNLMTTHSDA